MSSQLNVDTIVDKAGSGGSNVKMANTSTYVSDGGNVTQNTVQGLAKAWCNFTSISATAINDSLNVSSISDQGTGFSTPSYSSTFANAVYSIPTSSGELVGTSEWRLCPRSTGFATGSTAMACYPGAMDANYQCFEILGDLA